MDCGFDERLFYIIICIVWALTAAAFLALTFAPVRSRRPTGAARCSLLLGTTSALLSSLDAVLFVSMGDPVLQVSSGYGSQLLASIGSIFLSAAFRVFVHAWCDIASVLGKLGSSGPSERWSPRRWLSGIRHTATGILVVQVLMAILFSVSDYKWAPKFDTIAALYMGWLAVSLVGLLSIVSLVMLLFARRQVGDGKAEKSFRRVTLLNFLEQVLFDICWIVSGSLYLSRAYNEFGSVQAAVFSLNFLLQWLMHIQLIFFFTMCDLDDPLYSQESYANLLSGGCPAQGGPQGSAIGMAALDDPVKQPPPSNSGTGFAVDGSL